MKTVLPLLAPVLLLAGCGGTDGGGNTVAAGAPVAASAAPAGQDWTQTVAATPDFGMRMGNPDAPLKLIEYGSRACPYCALFDAEGLPELKAKYVATGKLSYEFRDYPVHGPLDVGPTLLGHCVDPAAFFPLLDQMMANQQTLLANEQAVAQQVRAQPNAAPAQVATLFADGLGYTAFVQQRGVTAERAKACLNDAGMLADYTRSAQKAESEFNVHGTPTFVLNGTPLENTGDWKTLEPKLKAAGG